MGLRNKIHSFKMGCVSLALRANDKIKAYRPQRNPQFPHLRNRLTGLGPDPKLVALATSYFFGIVRRQDSVPRCWGREGIGHGLPLSTE